MSEQEEERTVHTIEPPDPDTVGMVMTLCKIMESVAGSIPFPFTCADLMAAHLMASFEVGLMGKPDPKETRDLLVKGLDALMLDVLEAKGKLN